MLFATYGVTDNFDLGLAVPFVHVDLDARVDGRIFRTASGANSPTHSFDTAGADRATFTESGSSNGLGDMSIRAKYNFLRGDVTSFAAGLDLRLPTGDKDELLGTGATRAEMMFIYSGDYGRVSPHVNIGYTLSSGESSSAASRARRRRGRSPARHDRRAARWPPSIWRFRTSSTTCSASTSPPTRG